MIAEELIYILWKGDIKEDLKYAKMHLKSKDLRLSCFSARMEIGRIMNKLRS
jgi:hypothetical protein